MKQKGSPRDSFYVISHHITVVSTLLCKISLFEEKHLQELSSESIELLDYLLNSLKQYITIYEDLIYKLLLGFVRLDSDEVSELEAVYDDLYHIFTRINTGTVILPDTESKVLLEIYNKSLKVLHPGIESILSFVE